MGTPAFAVPVLEALVRAGHDVALAVCQPDKPKGRGRKLAPPPVKEKALELGLEVFQPERLRDHEAAGRIAAAKPDVMVVAAYGKILPQNILDIPPKGCLNVHASLLPAYRGAAPINWAIINGETKTGITIMKMDAGMDTGDMLMTEEEPILADDTAGSLTARLSEAGARLIVKALEELEAGRLTAVKQDESKATMAPMLKKEMGRINWDRSAAEIERLVRGFDPWPGAFTTLRGETLKIWETEVTPPSVPPLSLRGGMGGVITSCSKAGIAVATGEGVLIIRELQPQGGRVMKAAEYLAGHKFQPGEKLGGQ